MPTSFLTLPLAQFEVLAGDIYSPRGVALNEGERAYLRASLEERARQEESERKRQSHELELAKQSARAQRTAAGRLRYLVIGLTIFLVLAAALTVWALNQSQVAQSNAERADQSAATAVANQDEANAQRQLVQKSEATAQANFKRSAQRRNAWPLKLII